MDTTAPIRPTVQPTVQRERRMSLPARPAAAAAARRLVRAAVCAWEIPVDPSTAVLLTSELVTNAITHSAGGSISLVITCARGHLRVDVHDRSCSAPVPMDAPVDAEAGRGLLLINTLSDEWGYYQTGAGKAVYFMLAFDADP